MKNIYNIFRMRDFISINIIHHGSNAYELPSFKRYTVLKFGRTNGGFYQYKIIRGYFSQSDLKDVIYLIKRGYNIKDIKTELKAHYEARPIKPNRPKQSSNLSN